MSKHIEVEIWELICSIFNWNSIKPCCTLDHSAAASCCLWICISYLYKHFIRFCKLVNVKIIIMVLATGSVKKPLLSWEIEMCRLSYSRNTYLLSFDRFVVSENERPYFFMMSFNHPVCIVYYSTITFLSLIWATNKYTGLKAHELRLYSL